MIIIKHLDIFFDILSNKKSGIVKIKTVEHVCSVNIFQGDLVIDLDKALFMQVMSTDITEISFCEGYIEKTLNLYSLLNLLWDFSYFSNEFSNEFSKTYLGNHIIVKSPLNIIYKLGNKIGIETLLVYLFFSKSENRTLKDLLSFYSYKPPQDLKLAIYRLFVIGQLKITASTNKENDIQKDTVSSDRNIALQKLLNKISNL